jgi:hypothetical protein
MTDSKQQINSTTIPPEALARDPISLPTKHKGNATSLIN